LKILQLCIRVPFCPNDGATIAMNNAARALMQGGARVKTLAFNTNKNFIPVEKIDPWLLQSTELETVPLDLTVRPLKAFLNLFTDESLHVVRFHSREFEKRLVDILTSRSFDIVWFEGLFMSPYLDLVRKHSGAKCVLRSHNVEHIIWQRLADGCRQPIKRWYLNLLASRLKKYELDMLNRFDAILPITTVDEVQYRQLGCTLPMHTFPLGVNISEYELNDESSGFSVFHLGAMDWLPNQQAIHWFLQDIYPRLLKQAPDIKIYLAGRAMPASILKRADNNLIVSDRVDNAMAFMKDKPVMMVPLRSGGGMRVKIIEGMAAGKAIVSTSVGAEGIDCTDGYDIKIADTAAAFAAAIVELKENPELRKSLAMNARSTARKKYDNMKLGQAVIDFISLL
jgi:glycosyltransferase involved in cell wall biosynthesis